MAYGVVREFYKERPLQAGVLTGLLLAVVAYFGFDAVRANLNERRWAPLSRLAMLSFAYQTTLLIDVALWLVTARPPVNDAAPSDEDQLRLRTIRDDVGLPLPTDPDLGAVDYDDYDDYRSQLAALLTKPQWLEFALFQWDRWKWRNRNGIATWAAAMLSTGETADVLNRLADLNEWVSHYRTASDDCSDTWTRVPIKRRWKSG